MILHILFIQSTDVCAHSDAQNTCNSTTATLRPFNFSSTTPTNQPLPLLDSSVPYTGLTVPCWIPCWTATLWELSPLSAFPCGHQHLVLCGHQHLVLTGLQWMWPELKWICSHLAFQSNTHKLSWLLSDNSSNIRKPVEFPEAVLQIKYNQ